MTTEQAPSELTYAQIERIWLETTDICAVSKAAAFAIARAVIAADRALVASQAQPAAEPSVVRKALEAAQEVVDGVPQWHNAGYAASLIKQALKELDATPQQPAEPRQDSVHSGESSSPPTTKRGYLGSTVDGGIDDH